MDYEKLNISELNNWDMEGLTCKLNVSENSRERLSCALGKSFAHECANEPHYARIVERAYILRKQKQATFKTSACCYSDECKVCDDKQ